MFKDFVKAIQKNLQQMSKDSSRLFTVNVDTEELIIYIWIRFRQVQMKFTEKEENMTVVAVDILSETLVTSYLLKMVSYIPFGELIQYQMINIM